MVLSEISPPVVAHTRFPLSEPKPRMCVLAATPLTIHFFLTSHLRQLAKYFQLTLVCNPRNDPYIPALDLPVHQLAMPISRKIALVSDLFVFFSLCRLFAIERFDIVVTVVPKAGLLGMVASWLMGVPVRVHIFQGEVWASRRGLIRFMLKWMDSVTARLATHLLAVSISEKNFLEAEGVAHIGKVQVLGAGSICGVDTEIFRSNASARDRVRGLLTVPKEAVVCLFLGRLTTDKGVLELLQAFTLCAAQQSDLWLLLVGPDEDQIESRVAELVPRRLVHRIRTLGFTEKPEEILAASDFLCLPSYREGFGIVILEAAAVGIPAIGTDIYGMRDAIADGQTGRLVPVRDVDALAIAITWWCQNPQELALFGHAARERVTLSFEKNIVVENYVKFFRKLFGGDGE